MEINSSGYLLTSFCTFISYIYSIDLSQSTFI